MRLTHRSRPAALLGTAALVATTCGAFVVSAPVALAATGSFSGAAAADLVHVDAANIPGTIDVANLKVAPVTSAASTATTPRVTSHATNANLNLFSGQVDQNLLVDALQTALPDNATGVHAELISVPAAPVLTATVASADAHSRWNADGSCVTNGPISNSISKVADAVVLPGTPATIALTNNADPTGAVVSQTTLGLVKQPASSANYAVRSTSSTQVTSVSLFASALVVEVVTAPKVVATATGVPGTSTVDVTQPVLKVNGQLLVSGADLKQLNIPGAPVVELTAGNVGKTISADGTTATGTGNLLTLKVLDITGTITLLNLTIGDVTATAQAPAGGVNCQTLTDNPLRDARKDASATTVNAGKTFDYTITVPNRGNANLTNVTVKDTVTGTPPLELVNAVPAPTSSSGSTYDFSLGTIAPNQVKTIVMTFRVPPGTASGTDYSNKAVITAVYGGKTITKTVTTPYPSVDGAGIGPCDLSRSTKFASHLKVTPGENFTYYVNVFNQGGQACTDIAVKDVLVSGTKFVSCTYGCTDSGQLVTWNISSLPAGASQMLAVTVKTTATSGTLPNTADITPSQGVGGAPHTPGPTVTNVSVLSPSNPATRGGTALPATRGGPVLAATGGSPLVALGGIALLGTGLVLRRRRLLG